MGDGTLEFSIDCEERLLLLKLETLAAGYEAGESEIYSCIETAIAFHYSTTRNLSHALQSINGILRKQCAILTALAKWQQVAIGLDGLCVRCPLVDRTILDTVALIKTTLFLSPVGSLKNWSILINETQSPLCHKKLRDLLINDFESEYTEVGTEWEALLAKLPALNPLKFVLQPSPSLACIQILQRAFADNESLFIAMYKLPARFPVSKTVAFILRIFLLLISSTQQNLHLVTKFDEICARILFDSYDSFKITPIPFIIARGFLTRDFCLSNLPLFFPNFDKVSERIRKCLKERLVHGLNGIKLRPNNKLSNGIEANHIEAIIAKNAATILQLTNGEKRKVIGKPTQLFIDSLHAVSGLSSDVTCLYSEEQIFEALLFDLFFD